MLRLLILAALAAGCGTSAPRPQAPSAPPRGAASEADPPENASVEDPTDFEVDLAVLRLSMEDPELRMRGARTLRALGPRSRPAMVNLYDCLRHEEDLAIAEVCANALGGIGNVARTYLEDNPALDGDRAALAAAALETLDARASR